MLGYRFQKGHKMPPEIIAKRVASRRATYAAGRGKITRRGAWTEAERAKHALVNATTRRDQLPIGTRKQTGPYIRIKIGRGKRGWIFEHRHVMAEALGRPLLPSEEVHHRNDDPTDNRPENLELTSRGEHAHHHHAGVPTHNHATSRPSGKWSRKHAACIACGRTSSKHEAHGLCRGCASRLRRSHHVPPVTT